MSVIVCIKPSNLTDWEKIQSMRVWERSFKTSCTTQSLTVHARFPEFSHNL